MRTNASNEKKAIELLEKIDQKKKELKLLRKQYKEVFNSISKSWKEDVKKQYPQLNACGIGEYVGVDIVLNGISYNVFISEDRQKLYCMFCLDRKNKDNNNLDIKVLGKDLYDKLIQTFNEFQKAHNNMDLEKDGILNETANGVFAYFALDNIHQAYDCFLHLVKSFVSTRDVK